IIDVLQVLLLLASVIPGAANESLELFDRDLRWMPVAWFAAEMLGWRSLSLSLTLSLRLSLSLTLRGVAVRFLSAGEWKWKTPAEFRNELPVEEIESKLLLLRIGI